MKNKKSKIKTTMKKAKRTEVRNGNDSAFSVMRRRLDADRVRHDNNQEAGRVKE